MLQKNYDELIARESQHWANIRPDSENPQIWDDAELYRIFFQEEYEYLVSRIAAAGRRVLELGCGEGNLAIELAKRGLDVTGIDLSPERISRAREKAKMLPHQPEFQTGDLNTISLRHSAYDCVAANGSLHHILGLGRLLNEVQTALRPGGKLVVIDFIGMGAARKLLAAFLYAILPTYKPYRAKWKLRTRMKAFLSSEDQKRQSLQANEILSLHPGSPFEEISGKSIIEEIKKRFEIIEIFSFLPFWYYLAPKIKAPTSIRYRIAGLLRRADDLLVRSRLANGAYAFIEAQKH